MLLINTVLTEIHETWTMHCAWWKAETVRCRCLWRCFIHHLPFIKSFIFHTHPSFCFILCLTVPGGLVSRSSICQHHPGGWQGRLSPGERHQTWDAGLGSSPSHLYLSYWPLHLSAHDLELARQKERATTNDKRQSQNKHTSKGGEEKKSWITLSSSISLCWFSH